MAKTPDIPIPFPLSSAPGAKPQESAGRLINCYAEPQQPEAGIKAVWRRSPGLTLFSTTGFTGYRGAILVNGLLYVVLANRIVTVAPDGTATSLANLPGTKRVTLAANNRTPTRDIQCVDIDNGAYVIAADGVSSFSGVGVLPAVNSVAFQDGYFFWTTADKRVFASGINAATVNALTETALQSRPAEILYRGVPYKGMMFFFTDASCEIWIDAANSFPNFPYSRLSVFDRGLLSASAIAGHDENFGWLGWVADDFGCYRLNPALQPEKISPPDLDRLVEVQAKIDPTAIECGCYVAAGKSFWTVSSPSWTWEFCVNSEKWNERASFSNGLLSRWRGSGGVKAYGKWLVGDAQTGNLAAIDSSSYDDIDQPSLYRLESGPVEMFPNRMRVARADFDFVTGTGIASGSTLNAQSPQCMISWSDDGGVHWSNPVLRSLGAQAHSEQRVSATSLGRTGAQGRRWRLDVTDPVYAGVMGATMNGSPRAW